MLKKLAKCCCCVCICCCCRRKVWTHKVKFRFHILDIQFAQNDYFLPGSTYTIFQKKKKRNRIKSVNVIRNAEDLSCLEIDETLKITSFLKQDLPGKYLERFLPKKRKVIIRQNTKISEVESIYADIGHIVLNLHEIVYWEAPTVQTFDLIDTEGLARASVRVEVTHAFAPRKKLISWDPFACCRKPPKQLKQDRLSANKLLYQELMARSQSRELNIEENESKDGDGDDDEFVNPEESLDSEDGEENVNNEHYQEVLLEQSQLMPPISSAQPDTSDDMASEAYRLANSAQALPAQPAEPLVERVAWSKPFSTMRSKSLEKMEGGNIDFVVYSAPQAPLAPAVQVTPSIEPSTLPKFAPREQKLVYRIAATPEEPRPLRSAYPEREHTPPAAPAAAPAASMAHSISGYNTSFSNLGAANSGTHREDKLVVRVGALPEDNRISAENAERLNLVAFHQTRSGRQARAAGRNSSMQTSLNNRSSQEFGVSFYDLTDL